MARNPRKLESPELSKSVIVNRTSPDDGEQSLYLGLWLTGELIIETKPGENIVLNALQVIDLYSFVNGGRAQIRIADMLRRWMWKRGSPCREIIRQLDKHYPIDAPADQPAA
jgi:hypothetical protein